MDDLWAMKSEGVALIVCAISFQVFPTYMFVAPSVAARRVLDVSVVLAIYFGFTQV